MRLLQIACAVVASLFIGFQAQAETQWTVDQTESALSFEVTIGGSATNGSFEDWSAEITFDPARPEAAQVGVEVNVSSVIIDAPQAQPLISTPQWLDASGYPVARFVGRGFEEAEEGALSLPGMLSLKGIDVPVELLGTINITGDIAVANFATTLDRSLFSIGDDNPAVADAIEVRITLIAMRENE